MREILRRNKDAHIQAGGPVMSPKDQFYFLDEQMAKLHMRVTTMDKRITKLETEIETLKTGKQEL